ncbi:permease prefix domain 1-containing protein [Sporosarcina sp. Te-1]|uniref:permease prefix domain 1-containing protein n=1 Tax=Sporosarcina sp. Te-1 TaxID=2818390 RepID=UPI001A9DD75C|nr:permease prefix domain 1-containing protein [Sporosarcina sp. Te-1]QTD40249.1 hypothetical protein J3U78_15765 [Sporosarcina sp. Te-1]
MKQIDQLGNSIFARLCRKEGKKLKQELRSHLLVTVRDLKEDGKSEQEAFTLAIDRFKAENKGPLTKFQLQKKFAKWLLCSAILLVLVGLFFAANLFMRDKSYGETTAMMEHLGQIYLTKDDFTFEDKLALQEVVQRNSKWFDNISYFAFRKEAEAEGTSEKLFSQGIEGIGESRMMKINYNNHRYVEWEYKTYDYMQNGYLYYIFLVISSVIFILWGAVRIYNRKCLKAFVLTWK